MSDCSTRQSEQHRTCGACEELYMAPRCNRFGHVMLDENDEPDDDGMTFADYCALWKKRTEPTVVERCQQLEQVARDMYAALHLNESCSLEFIADNGDCEAVRARLEALGVSVDG